MAEHVLSILVKAVGTAQAAKNLQGIDRTISNIGANAGRGLRNLGTNLAKAGVIAAGALAGGVILGTRSLEELERVTNLTEGVIESTGGAAGVTAEQVRKMAQELEALTTADDKAIQSGQNMLLTFTGIGSDVFPAASKAMTDMAIAMAGGDVEAANFSDTAKQIGKALNDPVRGMTALRRSGVSFTQEQEDQVKALVKSGRTVDAQKLILRELEKEFGKAGEAAGTGFGADLRRVQDAGEDLSQVLARSFLPVLSRAAEWLTTKLNDPATIAFMEDMGERMADLAGSALDFAESIDWDAVIQAGGTIADMAGRVVGAFMALPDWVKQAVITGWGLNKLTGGALGSIVSELGRGLIKGVLGINAGVVNVNGGVVNGGGRVGAGAGAGAGGAGAGAAGGLLAPGLGTAAAGAALPFAMFYGVPAIVKALTGVQGSRPESGRLAGQLGSQPTAFTSGIERQIGAMLPGLREVKDEQSATNIGVTTLNDSQLLALGEQRDTRDAVALGTLKQESATRAAGMMGAMATGIGSTRIVSAIQTNKPIVNTNVTVTVTAAAVQKSVSTQSSYGAYGGSAAGAHNGRSILD